MPSKRGRQALEASSPSSSATGMVPHSSSRSSTASYSDRPVHWFKKRVSGVSDFLANTFSPSRKRLKIDAQPVRNGQLLLTNGATMADSASYTPPASGFVDLSTDSAAESSSLDTRLLLSSQQGAIRDPLGRKFSNSSIKQGQVVNGDTPSSSVDGAESQIQHTSPPSSPLSANGTYNLAPDGTQQDAIPQSPLQNKVNLADLEAGPTADAGDDLVDGSLPTDADVDHIQAVADAKVGDGIEGPLDWSKSPRDEARHALNALASQDDNVSDGPKKVQNSSPSANRAADVVDLVSDSEDEDSQNEDPDKENDVSLATPRLDSQATFAPVSSHHVSKEPTRARHSRHSLVGPMFKGTERKLRQGTQNDIYDDSFATFNSDGPADISAIEEVRNVGRQTHFVQPKRRNHPRTSTPLQQPHSTSRNRSYSLSSDLSMPSVSAVSHKTKSSTYKKRDPIYEREHKRIIQVFNEASFRQKISAALQNINHLRSAQRQPLLRRKHFEQLAIKTQKVKMLIAQDNARDASRVDSINDLVQRFLRQKEFDAQTGVLPLPPVKLEERKRLEKEQRAKMRRARGVLGRKALPERLGEKEEEAAMAAFSTRGTVSTIPGAGVTDQDMAKLRPGQWLNDEVINFYGTLILTRANEADKKRTEAMKAAKDAPAPAATPAATNGAVTRKNAKVIPKRPYDPALDAFWRVHVFSSFFWTNLKGRGFDGVKRWTRRIDIFSKDLILFPINLGNSHWVCGAINFRRRRFEYYDSLGARNSSAFTLMRNYVTEEARDKKKREIDLRGWVDVFSDQSPRQENGYDCGVFASMTLEQISRRGWHTPIPLDPPRVTWKDEGLDEGAGKMVIGGKGDEEEDDDDDDEYEWNFEQQNMPYLRKRMACEIYTKQLLD